jgi:ATP-binding cassette subfamily B protein
MAAFRSEKWEVGRFREMGAHQELLAQRGIYYKLYQLPYKDQEIAVPGD